jgi:hypothetical protein
MQFIFKDITMHHLGNGGDVPSVISLIAAAMVAARRRRVHDDSNFTVGNQASIKRSMPTRIDEEPRQTAVLNRVLRHKVWGTTTSHVNTNEEAAVDPALSKPSTPTILHDNTLKAVVNNIFPSLRHCTAIGHEEPDGATAQLVAEELKLIVDVAQEGDVRVAVLRNYIVRDNRCSSASKLIQACRDNDIARR